MTKLLSKLFVQLTTRNEWVKKIQKMFPVCSQYSPFIHWILCYEPSFEQKKIYQKRNFIIITRKKANRSEAFYNSYLIKALDHSPLHPRQHPKFVPTNCTFIPKRTNNPLYEWILNTNESWKFKLYFRYFYTIPRTTIINIFFIGNKIFCKTIYQSAFISNQPTIRLLQPKWC